MDKTQAVTFHLPAGGHWKISTLDRFEAMERVIEAARIVLMDGLIYPDNEEMLLRNALAELDEIVKK